MISDEQLEVWGRVGGYPIPELVAEVRRLRGALGDVGVTLSRLRPSMTLPSGGWDELETLHNRVAALTITSGRVRLPGDASDDEETKA